MLAKYLDLSTGHLSTVEREDIDFDAENIDGFPRVIKHEFGWFVNVQHDDIEDADEAMENYPGLLAATRHARSLGDDVNWMNFDGDGETVEGLPTFD